MKNIRIVRVSLFIRYGWPLRELLGYCGLTWAEPWTELLEVRGGRRNRRRRAKLIHFDNELKGEEAVSHLITLHCRGATIHELCSLRLRLPNLQFCFPIVALGTEAIGYQGKVFVPSLCCEGSSAVLRFFGRDEYWHRQCRFLAFSRWPTVR